MGPRALEVENHAVAELAVAHARTEAHAADRRLLGTEAADRHRSRDLHARAHLLDQPFGNLAHEARHLAVAVDAVQAPLLGVTQVQLTHGAGHAHITQPPLLLETLEVGERALVRKQALLESREEYHRELEALGVVQRHHLHTVLPLIRLALAGFERGVRQEGLER